MENKYESTRVLVTLMKEQGPKRATALIAYSLANMAPLPTTRTENRKLFFGRSVLPVIRGILSEANEQTPVRFEEILRLTNTIWEHRYGVLYPNAMWFQNPIVLSTDNLPPIYHNELSEIVVGDHLVTNQRLLEAAGKDFIF